MRAAPALVAAAALLLAAAGSAPRGIERPPPAHTGGFGEPTCTSCHLPASDVPGAGRLSIDGLPDAYEPGRTYRLRITLVHPGLGAGGFQLAARTDRAVQAGHLAPGPGDSVRVEVTLHDGIAYAQHAYPGTRRTAADTLRWTVLWTAPGGADTVAFHAAANAADDDESPLGDVIYTAARRMPPRESRQAIVPHGRVP
jgi:hypothetical protein